jgi:5'-nucleotidase
MKQNMKVMMLFLLILLSQGCESSKKSTFHLVIVHVNDIHSHLESDDYNFVMDLDANGRVDKVKVSLGGMARITKKIKSIQNEDQNVLTLNAGDLIQGTLYFSAFNGDASVAMYNQIVWDVFEVGNHEWDRGDAFLKNLLSQLESGQVLAANIEPDGVTMSKDSFAPYVIKNFGDERVGIVGIDIVQKTEESSNPSEHIKFLPELETAQKYIDLLLSKGIDKIILVSHVGYKNDLKYAQELYGVDVIVGGDSHTLMGDFSRVGIETKVKKYPTVVKNADGDTVCIVQAWSYSHALGKLNVVFDGTGRVFSCIGETILPIADDFEVNGIEVNATEKVKILNIIKMKNNIEIISEDTLALKALEPFQNQIAQKKNEVIGYLKSDLKNSRIPNMFSTNGSDISPLVCKGFIFKDAHADVCIQNAGAVRKPLNEGNITINDVYELLPFGSTLYELNMKGSEIKELLEDALSNYLDNDGGSTGSFPYAYALRYDINTTQQKGNRVSNLVVMDKTSKIFSPIDSDTLYIVVTNSYTAGGHDGYKTFSRVQEERGEGVDTYLDYAMSFIDFVKDATTQEGGIDKLEGSELPIGCYSDAELNTCK